MTTVGHLKGKSITFCWSPGQENIQGNEDADKSTKSVAASVDVIFKSVFFWIQSFIQKNILIKHFKIIGA